MDFKDFEDPSEYKDYLTQDQISLVRSKAEELSGKHGDEVEIVKLIDGFVQANNLADERYNKLRDFTLEAMDLANGHWDYASYVLMTLIPASLMIYFGFLLLVKVYTEDELSCTMKEVTGNAPPRSNEA